MKVKSEKLSMSKPDYSKPGGPVHKTSSVKFGSSEGKGTKSHFSMDTPNKAGGGWIKK